LSGAALCRDDKRETGLWFALSLLIFIVSAQLFSAQKKLNLLQMKLCGQWLTRNSGFLQPDFECYELRRLP
jgi:hypothetical protein